MNSSQSDVGYNEGMKLSVVLATFNEASNLARCLEAIKDLAHEIVLVDGGSADETRQIAKQFGARIIKTSNPPNFHINKQKALEAAKGDWILQLDADEVVTLELKNDIKKVLNGSWEGVENQQKLRLFTRHQQAVEKRPDSMPQSTENSSGPIHAYYIPRRNIFLGKPLIHSGAYPDGVIRLVKNGKAHFPCRSVHEQIDIEGNVSWLEHDLLHYDSPTLKRYWQRANRYTSFTASQLQQNKVAKNASNLLIYMIVKPTSTFLHLSLRHKGVLDGWRGIIWDLFSALHWPIAYIKYLRKHV